jgi:1,4-dihydroxy-2-naphthoate octaprenyltransferase
MNDENPYRSPLAECGGTESPYKLADACGFLIACGILIVTFALVWRVTWVAIGYTSEPFAFVYLGFGLMLAGAAAGVVSVLRDG